MISSGCIKRGIGNVYRPHGKQLWQGSSSYETNEYHQDPCTSCLEPRRLRGGSGRTMRRRQRTVCFIKYRGCTYNQLLWTSVIFFINIQYANCVVIILKYLSLIERVRAKSKTTYHKGAAAARARKLFYFL